MPTDTICRIRRASLLALTLLPPFAITASICWIDRPVALALWKITSAIPGMTVSFNSLPNLLPAASLGVTALFCILWFSRRAAPEHRFYRLVTIAVPLAFIMKTVLQFAFGHTSVRLWLQEGVPLAFRPFHPYRSAGFPSGHSLVLAAFLAAVWLYFPRMRFPAIMVMTGMAAALLATSYHFVSDILAGVWCGVLITLCLHQWLDAGRGRSD